MLQQQQRALIVGCRLVTSQCHPAHTMMTTVMAMMAHVDQTQTCRTAGVWYAPPSVRVQFRGCVMSTLAKTAGQTTDFDSLFAGKRAQHSVAHHAKPCAQRQPDQAEPSITLLVDVEACCSARARLGSRLGRALRMPISQTSTVKRE